MKEFTCDCLGKACPLPVIESKKKLAEMEAGSLLHVLVDGDEQVQNVSRMAKNNGHDVSSEKQSGHYVVHIVKKSACACSEPEASGKKGKTVIVFSQNVLGQGDPTLGATLMKSYIFSLTQLDEIPDILIFFNSGVRLTTAGSPALEDLKKLSDAGVQIFSCGTCLNFYGLQDKLEVGEVTNMYSIIEMQMQAGTVMNN